MVLCAIGGAGVDIFFVVSGFIIMAVVAHSPSTDRPFSLAARFFFRRAARVYPLYWITLATAAGIVAWSDAGGPAYKAAIQPPVLLLLTTHIPFQSPAWTLPFELWFYTGMATLVLLPRNYLRSGVALWAAAQMLMLCWHYFFRSGPDSAIFIHPQVLEFFLGCTVACLTTARIGVPAAIIALVCALTIAIAGFSLCYNRLPLGSLADPERVLFWGVPSSIAVLALVHLELAGKITTPSWLQRLGDNSYSIYLWHFPIMILVFVSSIGRSTAYAPLAQAATEFLVTLFVAAYSYRFIELPLIRLVHGLTAPASQSLPART